jgi:hypothetical protein
MFGQLGDSRKRIARSWPSKVKVSSRPDRCPPDDQRRPSPIGADAGHRIATHGTRD